MRKSKLSKILLAEIIAIVILLIVVFRASAEDKYYPEPERLNHFSYGVEESTDGGFVSFKFQNDYNSDKTVTTKGHFIFPVYIRIVRIAINYVITDADNKVLRTVNIISKPEDGNVYQFTVTYPFMAEYEKCIFEVFFVGEEIEEESESEEEPEKLNV